MNDHELIHRNIPIVGGNVPIIGQQQSEETQDPRNLLIAELMGVVSYNADAFKAIADDVKAAAERIDLPEHALQMRLLKKIGDVAFLALTTDPMAGAVLRMEASLISKFIRFVIQVANQNMTADEAATVTKAISLALEKAEQNTPPQELTTEANG